MLELVTQSTASVATNGGLATPAVTRALFMRDLVREYPVDLHKKEYAPAPFYASGAHFMHDTHAT